MKKFYVTLVALWIATLAFAQVDNLPFSKKTQGSLNEPSIKMVPFHQNHSKGVSASEWFSYYPQFFEYYQDFELESYRWAPIQCDTNVQFPYSGGNSTINFNGFGQIFNFGNIFWHEAIVQAYEGYQVSIPDITTATTYSVDSIAFPFIYWRGSVQPVNAVDTVIISILGDLTEADINYYQHSAGFTYPRLKYDTAKFVLKPVSGKKYHVAKVPLTVNDTTVSLPDNTVEIGEISVPVPGFTNMTNKNVYVFYTFKPGIRSTYNQVVQTEVPDFRTLLYYDPTGLYEIGAPDAINERNNSTNAMVWTFNGNNWPELLPPTSIWVSDEGIMRPAIYIKVTCDDCSMGSIKEMGKKNITINPNPATSNFTVDLGVAGQSNVEMFNLVGQKVYSHTTNESSITINVNSFKSGVYMLKVNQNGQVYTSKVVVK